MIMFVVGAVAALMVVAVTWAFIAVGQAREAATRSMYEYVDASTRTTRMSIETLERELIEADASQLRYVTSRFKDLETQRQLDLQVARLPDPSKKRKWRTTIINVGCVATHLR